MLKFANDLKISHKGAILVTVPLFVSICALMLLLVLLDTSEKELANEATEKLFADSTVKLEQLCTDLLSSATNYTFTKNVLAKESFEHNLKETDSIYSRLEDLSRGHEDEIKTLKTMNKVEKTMFRQMRGLMDYASDGSGGSGSTISDTPLPLLKIPGFRQQVQALFRQVHVLNDKLRVQRKERVATGPHKSKDTRNGIRGWICVSVLLILAVSGATWFFFTSITKRLKVIMDNAVLVSAKAPLLPALAGRDEISGLDATFHKMARVLERASLKERALIDNAVDVICSIDLSNRFAEVNPAAEALWGYASDELIGRRIVDVIHSEDVQQTLAGFEQCSSSSHDAELENRVKNKDGGYTFCLWSLKWVADRKTFFCVVHDITDRKVAEDLVKESESRLRMMVECLPIALFLSSADGIVETANIRAEQMYGYAANNMDGLKLDELFSPESGRAHNDFIDTLNERYLGKVSELDSVRKDGSVFPSEISVNSFVFGDSRKLLTVALDVTERHEIERFKQDLIAMVSHDLRSPLTSVQGLLSMLEEGVYGVLNERGTESITRSQAALDRLLLMIDELLDIEKMHAGKLHLNFEVVDLHSVMSHAESAINHLANKKDIRIETPENSIRAFGDSAKLVQVVVNLLSNAIKFSPEGSVISISYRECDDSVEVRIKDQGRGIPASHLESIFDKFQQVEAADHKEKGGKGLGLAICQSIIDSHGGTIGAENNEREGSTFWFRLPQPK